MGQFDFMVVGLGNVGDRYEGTRHNVGFMVLDKLKGFVDIYKKKEKTIADVMYGLYRDKSLILLKPKTFVNGSGKAVLKLASINRIPPENIIVVYDDVNLPIGKIRIRGGGSAGGHNGIRSIIDSLNSSDFPRVRIGIGPPPINMSLSDFVLGKFRKSERTIIEKVIDIACKAVLCIIEYTLNEAMNKFNGRNYSQDNSEV